MRIPVLIALTALFAATPAYSQIVDFTGPYDATQWTTTAGVGGNVDTSLAPTSIRIVGPDQGTGGNIDFTITAVEAGNVSFNWSYTSADDPDFDRAYWLQNGTATYIFGNTSTSGSGSVSFTANQGDTFGFRVNSDDGCCGRAELTVSGFAAVPEPETYAFVAAIPLVGFAFYRRVRHTSLKS